MKIFVQKRKIVGRRVKDLFEKQEIPGTVYGPDMDSINIKVNLVKFKKVFDKVGYSHMIDIKIEGDKKPGKALIREVQFDPVTDEMRHVSFYKLDLNKPITTSIPIKFTGKSEAVEESTGFLVTPIEFLEIRCLPNKLPDKFEISIEELNDIGDSIAVSELEIPDGVELTAEVTENATLAYIAPPQKEIEEEEKPVEEEELEGEEGEEGVEEGEGEIEGEAGAKETEGEEGKERLVKEVEAQGQKK